MKQQTVSWVRNISKTPAISGCGGLSNKAVARILCRSSSCVDLLLYNRCYSCCVGIPQNQTDAELFRLKAAQATQHSYHKKENKCGNLESRLIFGRPYRHQLLSWTVLLLSGCLFRFTFIIRSKDNVCFFVLWMTILVKHKQHHISRPPTIQPCPHLSSPPNPYASFPCPGNSIIICYFSKTEVQASFLLYPVTIKLY